MRTTITYVRGPEHTLKVFNKAVRPALRKMLLWWHKQVLPGHFRPGAAAKYKYRRRSDKYRLRTARQMSSPRSHLDPDANLPLVYSGRMRDQLMRGGFARATRKRATLRMSVPTYGKYHGKLYEVVRTTAAERKEMAQLVKAFIREELSKPGVPKRKRIG